MTSRRRLVCLTLLVPIALLPACTSAPRAVPPASTSVPGSAPGPAYGKAQSSGDAWTAELASAHEQLSSSLRGSGASVQRTTDGRVWVTLEGDQSFEPNRSALKPQARTQLDQMAAALRKLPSAELRIVGHTDSRGSTASNNALSLDRAASARDWLVARGLSPTRISVAGRGALDPVATNADEAGRARNRRVEILIGQR